MFYAKLHCSPDFNNAKMKTSTMQRALVLANLFNLLVAIYFIVISIVSLVQLRWYHQLTITTRVRHVVTSATSYFAFLILIFAAIILIIIFVTNTVSLSPRTYVSGQDAIENPTSSTTTKEGSTLTGGETSAKQRLDETRGNSSPFVDSRLILKDSSTRQQSQSSVCCSILLHLIASISLVAILIVWLLNTGELVRDSISTQLEPAFARYQFANRSNHYSIAIDGMQDINNCCGSLDYTDFPHQRISQLSSGHYPGSCCGKNIFGVNARVLCTPEEIVRAKQTTGCVTVLSNHYDLVSLLVVPVALASLFVSITMIALITISKGHSLSQESAILTNSRRFDRPTSARFELRSAA